MKILFWIPLLICSVTNADIFDDLKVPRDEVENIRKIADQLVEAGFPDATGAEFYTGILCVRSSYDPEGDDAPFTWNDYLHDPETVHEGSDRPHYLYRFNGFHVKLRDNTWLIGLRVRINEKDPRGSVDLENSDIKRVDPATILEDAMKEYPDRGDEVCKWFISEYPEEQKKHLQAIVHQEAPVIPYFELADREIPIAIILLHRGGMKEAPLLAYYLALKRSRSYWELQYWNQEPWPYDPTGIYQGFRKLDKDWIKKHNDVYPLEKVDVAFRRSLHRLFCQSMFSCPIFTTFEENAKYAKVMVDPGDPQEISFKIDQLRESLLIDEKVEENASVAERLRAWMHYYILSYELESGPAQVMGRRQPTVPPAYCPDTKDMDQLFLLLSDKRVSRYIDHQARTIGENAIRALARIFNRNPLELVDMAEYKPWTNERREEAVKRLQQWWKDHKDDYEEYVIQKDGVFR